MLVVGKDGSRRATHQRGDESGLLVEQQRLDLAAGEARLLPFHLGGPHHVGMLVGGFLRLRRDGIHGESSLAAMSGRSGGNIAERDRVRLYNSPSRIGGWKASPVSQGK